MLELTSPAHMSPGRLKLLEPLTSNRPALLKRLINGTYNKPFIEDCGPLRYLHFDLENVQSVMRHDDPDALCLAYTRKMMTFLLFQPKPRRILQLGLGGGSLAKFCYRYLPQAVIRVVEIDPHVLALRDEFRVPANNRRFRVIEGDAVKFVAKSTPREDVILVDACDRDGLSPALNAPDFYADLRRRLAPKGVLVVNICGDETDMENHAARMQGVFGDQLISLPAREDGNLIVLAFREPPAVLSGMLLDKKAHKLQEQYDLAFPRFVRQMTVGRVEAIF